MNAAQLALLISLGSAIIAATSLGWNIYRDVILKARVRVSIAIKKIVQANAPPSPDYIGISATNHGPGSVTLQTIELRDTSLWKKLRRKQKYAVLTHDYTNPYSGHLPKKLEVGETLHLFLDYDGQCFLKEQFSHIGLLDSFGRTHWARQKTLKELRKGWREKFNATQDCGSRQ